MLYGSVCSGIEAASVAWEPIGWQPAWFSEVDKFPSAVLAHRFPHVENRGDMTRYMEWPDGPLELLVGGTPCQSFSVAGLRRGLDDPRGSLMLTYLAIARRYHPRWIVWENVPGVLSSDSGRDFGTFLTGLAECGYGFAYRVLDAQYVRVDGLERAVPQRRRRVFVVGHLGDWRRAAAVLFDGESLSGNPPPRREAGKGAARGFEVGPGGGGFTDLSPTLDARCKDGPIRNQLGAGVMTSHEVAPCLETTSNDYSRADGFTMIAHALRGEGFDASEDGTGRGTPLVPVQVADTLVSNGDAHSGYRDERGLIPVAIQERAVSENPNAGPDGAGFRQDGAAYTLEARTVTQAVAHPFVMMERGRSGGPSLEYRADGTANAILTPNGGRGGLGVGAVAFAQNQRDELRTMDVAGALAAEPGMKQQTYLAMPWAVRRLTPTECERLQGFPDGWTDIPYRGKRAADGPRYKALGNSMAVNCMRWIGRRIQWVEETWPC